MKPDRMGKTNGEVMGMLPETELLQYIHKTADMGCTGLRAVVDYAEGASLKKALRTQLTEYQKLRDTAASMLRDKNEEPKGAGVMARASSELMSAGRLAINRSDSKIAEMAMEGNSMGISKTLRHLHDYRGRDDAVRALAGRLLQTEQANVEQMKPFL